MHSSALYYPSSLCAFGQCLSAQFSTAPIKCSCKQKRLQWLLGVSYSSTPELLRRTLSRWPAKRFMFSFHISSIFLGRGSPPGSSCINLRKRYPEVCHLINTPALLHQKRFPCCHVHYPAVLRFTVSKEKNKSKIKPGFPLFPNLCKCRKNNNKIMTPHNRNGGLHSALVFG